MELLLILILVLLGEDECFDNQNMSLLLQTKMALKLSSCQKRNTERNKGRATVLSVLNSPITVQSPQERVQLILFGLNAKKLSTQTCT
jgi:hypothetical protein